MNKYMVGVIQMDSGVDRDANLKVAGMLIDEAVTKGARLVSFPEHFNLRGIVIPEKINGITIQYMVEKAKEHRIYIHGGSIMQTISSESRSFNSTIMINPNGEIIAEYNKLHPFDVTTPDGKKYRESDHTKPGEKIVLLETELGKLGFAICYDLRFPELFRRLAIQGAEVIFCPANFTKETGKDHWEVLLRARAIENGCYIIAADQIGGLEKPGSFGSSLVADPWGTVIAKARETSCVVMAEIDLDYIRYVRTMIPSLKNRRSDIYG